MRLLLHWIITCVALFAAAWLVPGIRVEGNAWAVYAVAAVLLGLLNVIVRPVLKLLSCPMILLTLGLFLLVINGLVLWMTSRIAVKWFDVGFHVDGFWAAFLGALIVSLVSFILGTILGDRKRDRQG
jgi:putative membrane protein